MDQIALHETLGLPPNRPIVFTDLSVVLWGQDLIFNGRCDTVTFQLALLDCREVRWQFYAHLQPDIRPAFPPAELVNLSLGRDQHRSPLRLLTDYFGLVASYGTLCIEKPG
jgi:hypothetical protein